jgi:hypothetical protein
MQANVTPRSLVAGYNCFEGHAASIFRVKMSAVRMQLYRKMVIVIVTAVKRHHVVLQVVTNISGESPASRFRTKITMTLKMEASGSYKTFGSS